MALELLPSPRRLALHRPHAAAQHLGDGLLRLLREVPQHDHQPLPSRQRPQRLSQAPAVVHSGHLVAVTRRAHIDPSGRQPDAPKPQTSLNMCCAAVQALGRGLTLSPRRVDRFEPGSTERLQRKLQLFSQMGFDTKALVTALGLRYPGRSEPASVQVDHHAADVTVDVIRGANPRPGPEHQQQGLLNQVVGVCSGSLQQIGEPDQSRRNPRHEPVELAVRPAITLHPTKPITSTTLRELKLVRNHHPSQTNGPSEWLTGPPDFPAPSPRVPAEERTGRPASCRPTRTASPQRPPRGVAPRRPHEQHASRATSPDDPVATAISQTSLPPPSPAAAAMPRPPRSPLSRPRRSSCPEARHLPTKHKAHHTSRTDHAPAPGRACQPGTLRVGALHPPRRGRPPASPHRTSPGSDRPSAWPSSGTSASAIAVARSGFPAIGRAPRGERGSGNLCSCGETTKPVNHAVVWRL